MKRKKKIAFVSLLSIALAIAFVWVRLRSASAALEQYRKELVTKGEKLEIAEIAPHPSREQEALAHQLMDAINSLGSLSNCPSGVKMVSPGHALVNWREEALPSFASSNIWPDLQKQIFAHSNELNTVREVVKGPPGSFKLDYSQGFLLILSHLAPLKQTAVRLNAAAELELRGKHPQAACEDIKAALEMTRFLEHEPLLISQLVRIAMLQITLGGTWEILHSPQVTADQLKELQLAWESIETFRCVPASMEMERNTQRFMFTAARQSDTPANVFPGPATTSTFFEILGGVASNPKDGFEAFMERYPRFWAWKIKWSYYEELYYLQLGQASLEAVRKMQKSDPLLPALKEFDANSTNILHTYAGVVSQFKFGLDANLFRTELKKFVLMETERKVLVTAIALERFRIVHQTYPKALAELTPTYLSVIPTDAMDGKPLRYHLKPNGTFLLYSVGEDGVDNGGDATQATNSVSSTLYWQYGRDIVWPMPATPEEIKAYKEKMLAGQKLKRANR